MASLSCISVHPDLVSAELTEWDPGFTKRLVDAAAPLAKRWFRFEVRGLESLPPEGGALIVANHSGGMLTPDVLIFASAFYDKFGYERPLYTLGHDGLFVGPMVGLVGRARPHPRQPGKRRRGTAVRAAWCWCSPAGSTTLTGRRWRRTSSTSTAAPDMSDPRSMRGVPIVPAVSIGGQESQLFLTRGTWLAKRLGLSRWRSDILPVTVGFPFGLSVIMPPNLPLPTKIVTEVLEPIDIVAQFGDDTRRRPMSTRTSAR